ncbi:hypothetical protein DUI87_10632 [Hirundo rustica rustica]|uniref:Uncharacterized protein n=1 Tax=Hirundo rustica rustica TaxID=333673 RepID=A0A3M0KKD3_HIRRU|nr:hypothetical protein DUI87_10632 [Hirundo rustica rustica]
MAVPAGTPEPDAAFQMGFYESRVGEENHVLPPAGHSSFDAVQDVLGLLSCETTLLAHILILAVVPHRYGVMDSNCALKFKYCPEVIPRIGEERRGEERREERRGEERRGESFSIIC